MTFDPTKPVQTRDGRKARIICTDAPGLHPLVALVSNCVAPEEGEPNTVFRYKADGKGAPLNCATHLDLINIPEKHTLRGWVNVYGPKWSDCSLAYDSRQNADAMVSGKRIACIEITREFEEGEGL